MGWRKILEEFKGESSLKKKRGQGLKAFPVQEWSHLGTERCSNCKSDKMVQSCALCDHSFSLLDIFLFYFVNYWRWAKIWTFPQWVWCQKCFIALCFSLSFDLQSYLEEVCWLCSTSLLLSPLSLHTELDHWRWWEDLQWPKKVKERNELNTTSCKNHIKAWHRPHQTCSRGLLYDFKNKWPPLWT